MTRATLVPPRPPGHTVLWSVTAVILAVVAGCFIYGAYTAPAECAPGIAKKDDGDCVGVSDGSFAFPSLKDISDKIRTENGRIAKSGEKSVTIAYLESMSGGAADRGPEGIRQAVTGAHVAQLELNAERGTLPRVRLLLANTGRNDAYADDVVDQLLKMRDKEHLVAVAGIGQSNAHTLRAVKTLREAGVPTIGATVAADEMRSRIPGFFRISFPADAQAAAAAGHFEEQQDKRPGYRLHVVRDSKVGDVYNASLYSGFMTAAERRGVKVEEIVPFTSGQAQGQGNSLRVVAEKICGSGPPPDAVYFAARGRELRSFIEAAGESRRRCPVTVLSGSSAVGVYFDTSEQTRAPELEELGRRWKASGLKALYTAYTHPDASAQIYGGPERGPYADFERRYLEVHSGRPGELDNGQAMAGHDAVYTVGIAARRARDSYGPDHVTAETVLDLLGQTNGTYRVRGVSGLIAFAPDTGEPRGRPMALVELRAPDGDGGHNSRYKFVSPLTP